MFICVSDDGGLFGWGKNKHGNLGLGHTLDQFYPIRVCYFFSYVNMDRLNNQNDRVYQLPLLL